MSTGIDLGHGTIYHWDARRRPFIHPLRTKQGHVLSVDAPDDHPWHHGLWFTVKFVNGDNFWEEYDTYGVLRHPHPPTLSPTGAVVGGVEWIAPDRETIVIREARSWRIEDIDGDAYALDLQSTLIPMLDVTLDRTPFTTWGGYGGLTLRGRPDWHDTVLMTADGQRHDRVLGDRHRWCALSGSLGSVPGRAAPSPDAAAGDTAGDAATVAIFDHPDNPSHPTPWYASTRADTYGDEGWSNFFNAAFLWDGPIVVEAGDDLRFRYRVVVCDGLASSAWTEDRYAEWLR